jgi:hypothetical protein
MALGLTQPLTKISIENISWGVNAAGAQVWQPYHLHVPIILKFGSLKLLEGDGPVQQLLHLYIHTLHVWYKDSIVQAAQHVL